jgi:hypothetical protein
MAETDMSCLSCTERFAFGAYHRISGAPSWVKSEEYDLQAKVDRDHTDQLREFGIDQYQLMLQPSLAERFRLKFHWETKNLPVYGLVVAKNGSKLRCFWCGYCRSKSAPQRWIRLGSRAVMNSRSSGKPDDSAASQTPTFGGAQGTARTASGPSIFTAIQEQLGLELEPQEVSMEVLVIDHVEQPVEN